LISKYFLADHDSSHAVEGSQHTAVSSVRQAYEQQQLQTKNQICFDFTKGQCLRGDKCKYSHDLDTIVTFNSKEKGDYCVYQKLILASI
jgi:hypothetical protein